MICGCSVLPILRSNVRLAPRRFLPSECAIFETKSSSFMLTTLHDLAARWCRRWHARIDDVRRRRIYRNGIRDERVVTFVGLRNGVAGVHHDLKLDGGGP